MSAKAGERQALESFIVSHDLVELETRFARFNVFEALYVARQELKHSSFLAFLLDPRESHGLGDLFLRRFLQEVTRIASEPTISAVDLDSFDLSRTEVKREYENIDIFMRDPTYKISVVIENKVGTKEHDDQLKRYRELVTRRFPAYKFIGVYLTREGESAMDSEYVAISYGMVRDLVNELLLRKSVLITPAIRMTFEQYVDLLERRVMADQELHELCARIYKRHKQAIDILMKHIPDEYAKALEVVKELVTHTGYSLEVSDNHALRFVPKEFTVAPFRSDKAWLASGQMVYVECKKKEDTLGFQVKMDGGSPEERTVVHTFAKTHKPFRPDKGVHAKYQVLYKHTFLEASDLDATEEELRIRLKDEWNKFTSTDLAKMCNATSDLPRFPVT